MLSGNLLPAATDAVIRLRNPLKSTPVVIALRMSIWRANTLPMQGKSEGFVRELVLSNEAATKALGARIAAGLIPGDAILLAGDLGAGKTALARAVLQALGVAESVPSPTFTLVQHYETRALPVDHFDLYRIEHESELDELGLDDAISGGAVLIEWPERAGSRIPESALRIELEIAGETQRRLRARGPARWASVFAEGNDDS
jgi:tRNA threonylcarbamoyl adenosine modification protein YjeE